MIRRFKKFRAGVEGLGQFRGWVRVVELRLRVWGLARF